MYTSTVYFHQECFSRYFHRCRRNGKSFADSLTWEILVTLLFSILYQVCRGEPWKRSMRHHKRQKPLLFIHSFFYSDALHTEAKPSALEQRRIASYSTIISHIIGGLRWFLLCCSGKLGWKETCINWVFSWLKAICFISIGNFCSGKEGFWLHHAIAAVHTPFHLSLVAYSSGQTVRLVRFLF